MVHQLLRQPFLGVDALGAGPEQTAVRLEASLLPLGILPDFLCVLFDKKLQFRLFQLPLKLFGTQRLRWCFFLCLSIVGRGRSEGAVGWRGSSIIDLGGRGTIGWSFGVESSLRSNGCGSKPARRVRRGLFRFLLAGHDDAASP
jgi:hypothetical protein